MSEIRWEVYSDLIPLTGRPVPIGEVLAPDKPTALTRAEAIHGPRVVVQSLASRKCAARELSIPATLKTKREEMEERRAKALADTKREVDKQRRRQCADRREPPSQAEARAADRRARRRFPARKNRGESRDTA